ncbi:MAG TPA: C4-dicarboxylate ABC transporter, partial [Pelagibacterium sp.]|nr:C4-dicarboxylate ABC transporter [Pelagibacterium sp.]
MKLKSILLGAVASVSFAAGAMAQEVTLRVHQFLPAQATIPATAIAPWAEAIQDQSDGRIAVELYPAMQLGGAPDSLFAQA